MKVIVIHLGEPIYLYNFVHGLSKIKDLELYVMGADRSLILGIRIFNYISFYYFNIFISHYIRKLKTILIKVLYLHLSKFKQTSFFNSLSNYLNMRLIQDSTGKGK